jgi:iron complex outermembrane receptor protein
MRVRPASVYAAAISTLLIFGGPVAAQEGTITGTVRDVGNAQPIGQVKIQVLGGSVTAESNDAGLYRIRLPAGTYDFVFEHLAYGSERVDRIRVEAGQTTPLDVSLTSEAQEIRGVTVSVGPPGTVDTQLQAPKMSHSVDDFEVAARPALTPMEHLRGAPGVDPIPYGLQGSNVVVRGFNNIFSGAARMLTDYRLAGLPSLRVNLMHFIPSTDDDIERMEVVLGPGSALYGPNTANGLVHVITKSPLASQGTSVSVAGGERSVFQGSLRSAFLLSEDFGFKVSGQYLRGNEWNFVDPTEKAAADSAAANPAACVADKVARGLSASEAQIACGRLGLRDFDIERYSFEARADWRFANEGTFVATYGRTDASGIELTGLGAGQTKNWVYQFAQGRVNYDRLFAQGYYNTSDAGDSFLLRDGLSLVDESTLGAVQLQHGFDLADGRQDFTYGWDYFVTRPASQGTIYGDYEDNDDINEWGAFLQSKTVLSPEFDFIAAGRIDSHSILPENVFSPRLALVFKPDEQNALRLSYDRAFSTPSALNYFLDISGGIVPDPDLGPLGYTTRAFGSGRNGFAWQNPDGSLRGMRSPFNPAGTGGPGQLLPADQATLWQLGLGVANSQSPLPPDVLAVLQGLAPGASDVDIMLLDINNTAQGLFPLSLATLPDVPPITESNTETFEVGWTGILNGGDGLPRVKISTALYYMKKNDFVSPLVVETPLLFLDGLDIGGWLGPAYVPARVLDLTSRLGMSVAAATAQATAEAGALVPALAAGIGQLPIAVASSDVAEMRNGGADLIATYRNVGDLNLWGTDIRWGLPTGTWFPVSVRPRECVSPGRSRLSRPTTLARPVFRRPR